MPFGASGFPDVQLFAGNYDLDSETAVREESPDHLPQFYVCNIIFIGRRCDADFDHCAFFKAL